MCRNHVSYVALGISGERHKSVLRLWGACKHMKGRGEKQAYVMFNRCNRIEKASWAGSHIKGQGAKCLSCLTGVIGKSLKGKDRSEYPY